ncbi:hypothetical protein V6N13_102242 [Hibiscus sabdariffa]
MLPWFGKVWLLAYKLLVGKSIYRFQQDYAWDEYRKIASLLKVLYHLQYLPHTKPNVSLHCQIAAFSTAPRVQNFMAAMAVPATLGLDPTVAPRILPFIFSHCKPIEGRYFGFRFQLMVIIVLPFACYAVHQVIMKGLVPFYHLDSWHAEGYFRWMISKHAA